MRIGRKSCALAAFTMAALLTAPSAMATEPVDFYDDGVWIYGQAYKASAGCFNNSETKRTHRLQLRGSNGDWETVATTKPASFKKRVSDCPKSHPYLLTWKFVVSELGERLEGERYRLQVREVFADNTVAMDTKIVYTSKKAQQAWNLNKAAEAFADLLSKN